MKTQATGPARLRPTRVRIGSSGFSVLELLVGLTIGMIIVTAISQLFITQARYYQLQRAERDVRETLRAASALLTWQLREASSARGDLYALGATSMELRAVEASAVACAYQPAGGGTRFGLQEVSGYFQAASEDSVLAYSPSDGSWLVVKVGQAWNDEAGAWSGAGTSVCFWGDSTTSAPRPQAAIELQDSAAVLSKIEVGSAVKAFRRTEYGLFQQDGRWWLGRKVGGASEYELLTGPLLSPADSGLSFTFRDMLGGVTADPAQVARVDILLRAESAGRPARPGSAATVHRTVRDSLRTTVVLRNAEG